MFKKLFLAVAFLVASFNISYADEWKNKYECTPQSEIKNTENISSYLLDKDNSKYLISVLKRMFGEPPFDVENTRVLVHKAPSELKPVYFFVDDDGCTYMRAIIVSNPEIRKLVDVLVEDNWVAGKGI